MAQIADSQLFVSAMRSIASSVAVVTTGSKFGAHGATVSSFCSVSAEPPAMLVCLNANSRIAERVRDVGWFNLNILSQDMEQVANRFAGRQDCQIDDRFFGINHTLNANGCPQITGALVFECKIASQQISGTHSVVIGQVENINGAIERPLTYLDGAYRPWLV